MAAKKSEMMSLRGVDVERVKKAKILRPVAEAIEYFRKAATEFDSRKDVTDEFKKKFKETILNADVLHNYEIVYYPVYKYELDAKVKWETTSFGTTIEINDQDGRNLDTIFTDKTTHYHSKHGYAGYSDYVYRNTVTGNMVKIPDYAVYNDDKLEALQNFRTLSVPVFSKEDFFTAAENKRHSFEAAKEKVKTESNQRVSNQYRTHMVLLPFLSFTFECCGQECSFRYNMHSGWGNANTASAITPEYRPEYVKANKIVDIVCNIIKFSGFGFLALMLFIAMVSSVDGFQLTAIFGYLFVGLSGFLGYKTYDETSWDRIKDLGDNPKKTITKWCLGTLLWKPLLFSLGALVAGWIASTQLFGESVLNRDYSAEIMFIQTFF